MFNLIIKKKITSLSLLCVLFLVSFAGLCPKAKEQPVTVADILSTLGDTKRDMKIDGKIDAQTDLNISRTLLAAVRTYKKYVQNELDRLERGEEVSLSSRTAIIKELVVLLAELDDPAVLGIKSEDAKKIWRLATTGLKTVLNGLRALQGKLPQIYTVPFMQKAFEKELKETLEREKNSWKNSLLFST